MWRKYLCILISIVSIAFSSCINSLEEEGIYELTRCHGFVLDERTHQPLQDVRVMGTDGWDVGKVAYTAADGSFEVFVTLEQLAKSYFIRIESDSLYETYDYSLADVSLGTKEHDMGIIYLKGPQVPIVLTTNVVDITPTSAHCFGSVVEDGNSTIHELGFVYSTMQYPTIDDNKVTAPFVMEEFNCELPLEPHTTYYVRAYAVNHVGVGYSDQVEVTTLDGLAQVSTGSVFNITTTSAMCGGEVTANSGFNVVARGVCWSTSPEPTITNAHTVNGSGIGSFTSQMRNLEPNTVYYVRAYAQNSSGIAYGAEKTFSTLSGLPEVSTTIASNITASSALSGGTVVEDGGYPVIRRGVCYGTSSQPTISGLHTTDGAGLGEFVSQMTNLTPGSTYYYRAYATNGVGTVYGEQHVFVAW